MALSWHVTESDNECHEKANRNVFKVVIVNFKSVQKLHLLRIVEMLVVFSSELINKPQNLKLKFSKVNY